MKRKIISILVSVILIICSILPGISVANAAVWNGAMSMPSLSGGVYQIATAENLAWFANAVNSGSNAIKGKLTSDITLNSAGSFKNEWTPIGTESRPFAGQFDGDGHTISGVYVNSTNESCKGLFGKVSLKASDSEQEIINSDFIVQDTTVCISNVNVENSSISGYGNVGGIVGLVVNGAVFHSSFSGTVVGANSNVGGIAGSCQSAVINECYTSGTVTGRQRTGGTVGYSSGSSVIVKCYGDMAVTGTKNVGGTVGTLSSGFVEGCFFLGSVTGEDVVGGLIGYALFSSVMDAYSSATISCNVSGATVGGAIADVYSGKCEAIYYNYDKSGFDCRYGVGRTVEEMMLSAFVKEINSGKSFFCMDYTHINNGFPVLTWMLSLDVWLGESSMPAKDSTGTYLISKPSELAWFSKLVNGTLQGYDATPNANAKVVADLLLNMNVYDDSFSVNEWTPIGTASNPYSGIFNGGGYNIAGIYTTKEEGSVGSNVGLFGYVSNGTIMNTIVVDGQINGIENVGGIVGYMSGGSISNCCCKSEVFGDKAVGGIAGYIGSSTTQITNSCMLGSITGTNFSNNTAFLINVGGVVGYNNRATVSKCFNYGKINAPLARYVGGVIGNNSGGTLNNSYNTSPSIVGGTTCGGIVAYNNNGTVQSCYTSGKVSGSSVVGIAFGSTSGPNVSSCSYDSSYMTLSNIAVGAKELTPAQMTASSSLSTMGLGSTNWKTTVNDEYHYYYPQLLTMYSSNIKTIKDGSAESVRRVQDKFVARVQIDGRIDTFYENINDAISYAMKESSIVLPTVYVIRDVSVASTVNVASEIGLFGENGATLTRDSSLTGAMFNVTGSLTIGSKTYGDDDDISFYVDGKDVASTVSAICVSDNAELVIEKGVEFHDFNTALSGTGAVIKNQGSLKINGGIFYSNKASSVGGVVNNVSGTVLVTDGTFIENEATQGAAIFNNNGTVTINGGEFRDNIAKTKGGVVASYDLYATTVIQGKANLVSNEATDGGAIAALNYSTTEINGGYIAENRAYSVGGAVTVESGAELKISGGVIVDNTSDRSVGNAVYNNSTVYFESAAQIDSGNDVYLTTGKTITVSDRLICSGAAAVITPSDYTEGRTVLDGKYMSQYFAKFDTSNSRWHILANGKLTNREASIVAVVSKKNAYSVEYTTISDAFSSIEADEDAIITLTANAYVSSTITVHGDVTLTCDDQTFKVIRSGSFTGVMFDVAKNSKLRLGEMVENPTQQALDDYKAGADSAGLMVIDGGKELTGVVGAAAVNVQSGAELYMNEGAVIQNCKNTTTGTVTVSGTMHMFGGVIRNNEAAYGGAVNVKTSGNLITYGGVIAGNKASNGGDAVYSIGKVTRNVHTYSYLYIETIYDENGDYVGIADPVLKGSSKTDVFVADGDAVKLGNNVIYCGTSKSDVYITNLSQIPERQMERCVMTIDFGTYNVGSVVVSGEDVLHNFEYFKTMIEGYKIQYTGVLVLGTLIPKSTSGLKIDRNKGVIYGFDNSKLTVGQVSVMFENDRTNIRIYDINNKQLTNSKPVTTGCVIKLLDNSGKVVESITMAVFGDINRDYVIDGTDAVLIKMLGSEMNGIDIFTNAQLAAADVNLDGDITDADAEFAELKGLFL